MDTTMKRTCLVLNLSPDITDADVQELYKQIGRINPQLIHAVGMFTIDLSEVLRFQAFDKNLNPIPSDRFLSALLLEGAQRIAITPTDHP